MAPTIAASNGASLAQGLTTTHTLPAGIQGGDIIFILVLNNEQTATGLNCTTAGYTPLNVVQGTDHDHGRFYKVAAGSVGAASSDSGTSDSGTSVGFEMVLLQRCGHAE